jgi:hypothetical protein
VPRDAGICFVRIANGECAVRAACESTGNGFYIWFKTVTSPPFSSYIYTFSYSRGGLVSPCRILSCDNVHVAFATTVQTTQSGQIDSYLYCTPPPYVVILSNTSFST